MTLISSKQSHTHSAYVQTYYITYTVKDSLVTCTLHYKYESQSIILLPVFKLCATWLTTVTANSDAFFNRCLRRFSTKFSGLNSNITAMTMVINRTCMCIWIWTQRYVDISATHTGSRSPPAYCRRLWKRANGLQRLVYPPKLKNYFVEILKPWYYHDNYTYTHTIHILYIPHSTEQRTGNRVFDLAHPFLRAHTCKQNKNKTK
jgi:hypothetical protein